MTIAQILTLGRQAEATKVGYDQKQRWSFLDKKNKKFIANKETDCSALTAGIFYLAGYPIDISGTCWTGNIDVLVRNAGGKVLKYTNKSAVIPGDAILAKGSHVALALSKTEWLSAEKDERGKASGGQAGDQTGKEVYIRAPYERSGGWDYILRFPADPVTPSVPAVTGTVTANALGDALKSVGIAASRSSVRIRRDKTSVPTSLTELAALLNKGFGSRKLNRYAVATFVATMLQESDWLRTTVEYSDKDLKYDPYRGRTFEQITGKANYAAFGKWAQQNGYISDSDQFVKNPESLGDLKWAWLGGFWYFDYRNLWTLASRSDFQRVETAVNFGTASTTKVPGGWSTRILAYRSFLKAFSRSAAIKVSGTMTKETVKRLQEHVGAEVDGVVGPQTWYLVGIWIGLGAKFNVNDKAHVKKFQKKIGLNSTQQDGIWWMPKSKKWGPITTSTLQSYLNGVR